MTSEPKQEEDVLLPVIDHVLLSLVHQSIIQQQATSRDLPVTTVETEHVSPVQMAPEQSKDQPEPELSLVPLTYPASLSIDLVMVSKPARYKITADFVFPTGAPVKTPFLLTASRPRPQPLQSHPQWPWLSRVLLQPLPLHRSS